MIEPRFPVFVLSLHGDGERRGPLLRALTDQNISHTVFFGVDGREKLPSTYERHLDRGLTRVRNRRSFTDGEYACALSHLEIYSQIVSKNIPGAIILEDDAIVSEEFSRFLLESAFYKAEIVLLGHHRTYVRRFSKPRQVMDGVKGHRVAKPPSGAFGYSLSARAAQWILDRSFPISKNADWPCDISRIDTIALSPRLVMYDRSFSHIHTQREEKIKTAHPPRFESFRRLGVLDDWTRLVGKVVGVPLDPE